MICVIGSLNMDLVVRAKAIPKVGETLIGDQFSTIPGGKGANQAVAASRMGAETFMIGKLGADPFGEELRASLESSGVNCRFVFTDNTTPSGVAMISVNETGGNSILVAPGANFALMPADIDRGMDAIKGCNMLVLQNEIPMETIAYTLEVGKREGKITVMNPAPACQLSESVLKNIDFLIPNEHELSLVSGCPTETDEEQEMAAKALLQKGVGHVLVTLGDKGCMVVSKAGVERFPAMKVTAVDTTAAGDSFIGGFCAVYENGGSIEEAVMMAQKAAALSVTRKGAQTSIATLEEVKTHWKA